MNKEIVEQFRAVINRNRLENGSDTPDFILAEFLAECLEAFNKAVNERDRWHYSGSEEGSIK